MFLGVLFIYLIIIIGHSQDARGHEVDLSTYKGKVLLIVNVASKWYCVMCMLCFSMLLNSVY